MALTKIDDRGLKTPVDLLDNEKIRFGTGNDLEIYHSGSASYIQDNGAGDLIIRASDQLKIQETDGGETMAIFNKDGAVELYHNNVKKFQTDSAGASLFGNLYQADNDQLILGTGSDLKIYHDGTSSYINNYTGNLELRPKSSESGLVMVPDGTTKIYYDGSKKLETTSAGATLSGNQIITQSGGTTAFLQLNNGDDTDGAKFIYSSSSNAASIQVAESGSGFKIACGGTNAGNRRFQAYSDTTGTVLPYGDENMGKFNPNGSVDLYYDNSKKFETTSSGATITGSLGIGAASPGRQLEINDDAANVFIRILSANTGNAGFEFGDQSDTVQGAIYQNSGDNSLRFNGYNNAERMRIDSSGRLLVGHTADIGYGFRYQVVGTDGNTSSISQSRFSANASGPSFVFSKSRNGTPGSNTIVNSGDTLGLIQFRGDDGTDYLTPAAAIEVEVDGAPGANDMPGRLMFYTTANGANSVTERMRIDSTGRVGIGDTSPTSLLTVGSNANIRTANPTVLISPGSGDAQLQLRGGNPTIDFDCSGGGIGRILTDGHDFAISNGTIDGFGTEILRVRDGGGITFNGDTAAANALDDYEEGTFTPTLSVSGNSNANVTLNDGGTYTKVGRHVYARAYITLTSKGSGASASTAVMLGGLPFTAAGGHSAGFVHYWHNTPTDYVSMSGTVQSSSTNMLIRMATAAHDQSNNMRFDGIQDGTSFIYSVSYEV